MQYFMLILGGLFHHKQNWTKHKTKVLIFAYEQNSTLKVNAEVSSRTRGLKFGLGRHLQLDFG